MPQGLHRLVQTGRSHVINYDYQYAVAGRANGAPASLKLDSGSLYTVNYAFDNVGRLGSLAYNTATAFSYAYVANSNLVDTVAQGTTGYKRDYDYESASNRVSTLKNQFGSITASTVENRLTYDFLGRRNTEKTAGTNWMAAVGRGAEAGVHADYQYTDRSELDYSVKYQLAANWVVGNFRTTTDRDYTYDPMGNRTADNIGGIAGSYLPNSLNQYTSAPGAPSMGYDANGNLTGDGTRTYEYDGENRLIKVTQGASVWNYAYDYLGRRVRKWGTGLTEQRFIYDGWNLIAETDASGNLTRRYAWGLDVSGTLQGAGGVGGLLLIQDGSNTYYPLYDASHNVIGLYNGSGGIDSAYEYDPFGKLQTQTGTYAAANPFRFSTKYTDNETNLTYYGHRYYSATLGRFINRDPIAEAGGINLYGFCGNDGVNRYDYLGQSFWTWVRGIGEAILKVFSDPGTNPQPQPQPTENSKNTDEIVVLKPFEVWAKRPKETSATKTSPKDEPQGQKPDSIKDYQTQETINAVNGSKELPGAPKSTATSTNPNSGIEPTNPSLANQFHPAIGGLKNGQILNQNSYFERRWPRWTNAMKTQALVATMSMEKYGTANGLDGNVFFTSTASTAFGDKAMTFTEANWVTGDFTFIIDQVTDQAARLRIVDSVGFDDRNWQGTIPGIREAFPERIVTRATWIISRDGAN